MPTPSSKLTQGTPITAIASLPPAPKFVGIRAGVNATGATKDCLDDLTSNLNMAIAWIKAATKTKPATTTVEATDPGTGAAFKHVTAVIPPAAQGSPAVTELDVPFAMTLLSDGGTVSVVGTYGASSGAGYNNLQMKVVRVSDNKQVSTNFSQSAAIVYAADTLPNGKAGDVVEYKLVVTGASLSGNAQVIATVGYTDVTPLPTS